MMLNMITVEI